MEDSNDAVMMPVLTETNKKGGEGGVALAARAPPSTENERGRRRVREIQGERWREEGTVRERERERERE